MTDKQKLDAVLMLLNPALTPQSKVKKVNEKTHAFRVSVADAAAKRAMG